MLLLTVCFVIFVAQESVCEEVKCYAEFNGQSGSCGLYLGDVDQDDCCLNPRYGYKKADGRCQSCRPASWSEWTPWGPCSVSCLEGVRQRRRACYGLGHCGNTINRWDLQTKACVDKYCCPVPGGWTEWGAWQACSVTCEKGHKRRTRNCTQPPPACGGSCHGPDTEMADCDTKLICPIHGGWAVWGNWGTCSSSCMVEGSFPPLRQRIRSCSDPPPSTDPPGHPCLGSSTDTQNCSSMPLCPVPGGWGLWSPLSECSVTCGVGQRVKRRQCDRPVPKHRGKFCPGEDTAKEPCNTKIHCPVDGQWSEWGPWEECKRGGKNITCSTYSQGMHRRQRRCKFMDWGGQPCPGDIVEAHRCFRIEKCIMKGNWSEWSEWSLCSPNCGPKAQRTRIQECKPLLSNYKLDAEPIHFSGMPQLDCPESIETSQTLPCQNVPSCTDP